MEESLKREIEATLAAIRPMNKEAMAVVRSRQDRLTKPAGSLGRLEEITVKLAGITGNPRPRVDRKCIVLMAGDHGVVSEGVSAYPSEVTPQMVFNFLQGGAAINVLARQVGARVVVADLGVASDLPEHSGLLNRKIGYGTRNMMIGPAMTKLEALKAVLTGIEIARQEAEKGMDVVGTGDMGIGNTTPSSAIVATFTGLPVSMVTGRGTGLDDSGLSRKISVIERSIEINQPDKSDPLDVLAKVGGFEIAGLTGLIFGAAAAHIPIVVDGFISTAAALIATEWYPPVCDYLISAHNSVEIGHRAMLEHMELSPLLNLNLRLGEGTGAAIAMSVIEAATRTLAEMATFDEAGVSESESKLEITQ
ncbi:MAG: nicotinate-nucleotide--dimethylbenzimidazole phosphoribosyltransferase [Chloroflexi bacterium]|uniref:Nicotinate-nucleotide--dimethylbenzimidazole phosphoribosyltransferase n=1 Tax=Candidatus Chlorohelix allophototropha TaxID=3003348 RepID=A0A8T7LZL4_9CHLR|nr:nicotinate-nucleotide--dimethylbenzimidazole phosphoribosyltransferase [Chloroflexota bacterium]WJW67621.1 nicotinate-nucleotide--dimethylbenzimidazole phosphoribosyltransferase [Chloroflexota bacterium L227-S17]